MQIIKTSIPDVIVFEPKIFRDDRGSFFESYHEETFKELTGQLPKFVQDNQSRSRKGVLRGLHYQNPQPQGKLVRVMAGEIFDVVVDLRSSSPTFGQWVGMVLSADNNRHMWVPEGFAHGFLALSETVDVLYKTTRYYAPQHEKTILWNDADLAIPWPELDVPLTLSAKDEQGLPLQRADLFP